MAARLAILKAVRQLAVEADVHVHIRKFNVSQISHRTCALLVRSTLFFAQVINQVGAVSIDAKLDCDAFASTHSATSHYDRASFVGLAWRPGGEPICCEVYSTGKANLPGSTRQRDLLTAFSRMVSELLRHSDKPEVAALVPEHLRMCHRPRAVTRDDAPVAPQSRAKPRAPPARAAAVGDLFAAGGAWALGPLHPVAVEELEQAGDEELLDLAGF